MRNPAVKPKLRTYSVGYRYTSDRPISTIRGTHDIDAISSQEAADKARKMAPRSNPYAIEFVMLVCEDWE